MNKITKYITGLAAAVVVTAGFSSCQDDIDTPAPVVPEADVEANISILDLKTRFWSDDTNYADSIYDPDDESHRFIIKGRVISSDKEGNIFKSIVIQDETAALAFSVDSYNLYLNYRRGQEVVIDVTGMTIGKYAGLQQIGHKSWYADRKTWQVSFMAFQQFSEHTELNGMPSYASIDTLVANTFSDIPSDTEGLRKYQSQLVRFKNVYFADGGQKNFSVYHTKVNEEQNRTLVDREGNTRIVRTSGYATWCEKRLPAGNIDLVGILGYYNDSWQILMLDYEGVINVGEVPGAKDKPYDVPGAIKDINNGITANGWVKGYIVGAVAPEVETVTGNGDIQWEAPTVMTSTLVVGPDPECKEISQCLVVQLPAESTFREVGNLRDNPANLGKQILVKGDLVKFMGTPGITGNSGKPDQFEIEGVTVDTGEVPAGNGQEASPYNVAQVIAKGDAVSESGMWVKGYIVGSIPTGGASTTLPYTVFGTEGAAPSNLVLAPTADCTDPSKCIPVQLVSGSDVRKALNIVDNPGNLGKLVAIKGDLAKYCGAPGIKNPSAYTLTGGGDTPVTPPASGAEPTGEGTLESPYNVAKALQVTMALPADQESADDVYVAGEISRVDEISTNFGNATYYIVDPGYTTEFYVFRGYWLNGDKFTSTDQMKAGAKVVVKGKLINYKGNTPEFAKGNQVVSYDGESGGGTEPDPGPGPDNPEPGTPGDAVNIDLTPFKGPAATNGFVVISPLTEDGYTFTVSKASGKNDPGYYEYTDKNTGITEGTIRLYANNTLNIKGSTAIAKIVFTINTATGAKRYATFSPSTGNVGEQASGDTSITWTGNSSDITFTVGATSIGTEAGKPGQVHIQKIEIYPAK
ncbi:MAG: hypothetical protein K1W01_06460 [Muribaculaceae bacterium]